MWEDLNFIQEEKCEEDLPSQQKKTKKQNPSSSSLPYGPMGLGCPSEATDMGFQRQSGCDRTPLEFRGMPALPLLIIGPFTEITFFSEWLWSYSSGYKFHEAGCMLFRKGCDIPAITKPNSSDMVVWCWNERVP